MHKSLIPLSTLSLGLLLSGCTVLQPDIPEVDTQIMDQWSVSEATEQTLAIDIDWREFFKDPKLEQLIELALENNRDLRTAILNVELVRANHRIQRSDRLPSFAAGGTMTRQGGDGVTDVEQYQADLGISQFELDLWGRVKNLSDAALKSFFAAEENRKSAELSLIAAVANAYYTLAADNELLRITDESLQSYEEELGIAEKRFDLGAISSLDLSQSRTLTASARAQKTVLDGQVAQDLNALKLLVAAPFDPSILPQSFSVEEFPLAELPSGIPSEVLLRRPDILAAEYDLLSASANIGAARAAFFPSISLTGSIGTVSGDLSDLFSDGTGFWTFVPTIRLPIFQGGALRANRDAAVAQRDIALAQYEGAIQTGFQEVANGITLSETLANRRKAMQDYLAAATETHDLSQSRYDAGLDSYLNLLDAQRTLFSAQQSLVQSLLAEQANKVNLYTAMGGGWTDRS